ncbi:hypothetical protein [Komagataeibacter kakiaceti]|uniref:hypothetical protein n=1 Tax=Komagataeibacter kakiaceti TaxID=943261 RepID=UPI0011DE43B4|nr:hypothetical protein [Komagataeibacter kakiaceti]
MAASWVTARRIFAPASLAPVDTLCGVRNAGCAPGDIVSCDSRYILATTPDSRIGVLAVDDSFIGWRRPYHNEIALGG